jgi:hypothetical protein
MAQKSASPGLIFRNIMSFDGTFGIWFPMSGQAGLIAVSICHASIQTLWLSFSQDFSSLVREIIAFVQRGKRQNRRRQIIELPVRSFKPARTGFPGRKFQTVGCTGGNRASDGECSVCHLANRPGNSIDSHRPIFFMGGFSSDSICIA